MHTNRTFVRSGITLGIFCIGLFLLSLSSALAATTATLLPVSDGNYAQWTPKAGVTHYTQVDETTCNGTTDYVSETTVGERDSYGISLSSIPDGSTITNIQITPCASRNSNGGGSSTMNVFYRYNGSNSADAGAYAVTGTTPVALSATNFASLAFVKGSTSTLEIGSVYSAGTKGVRLSRMATVVTYTPLPPIVTTSSAFVFGTTTITAILSGNANPNGATTDGWFRYSTTNPGTCDDTFGTRSPSSGGTALGSGTTTVAFNQATGLLTGATTYYFCALASNQSGTSTGAVLNFSTP